MTGTGTVKSSSCEERADPEYRRRSQFTVIGVALLEWLKQKSDRVGRVLLPGRGRRY